MTNKNQVGDTVWFYSHSNKQIVDAKIKCLRVMRSFGVAMIVCSKQFPNGMAISPRDLYDTRAEAVEATRAWAENGIKNLQTILDNLKEA